jgi:hypothetical protein
LQEGERVHAVAQDAGAEAHRDVPGVGIDDAAARPRFEFAACSTGSRRRRAPVAAEELFGQRRQQRVAARLDGGVGLRQAGGEDVEQRAQVVAAFEHHRRQFAADRDLAVAQLVEDVLDLVREGFDEVALDDAGATLDGVRGAEDGALRLSASSGFCSSRSRPSSMAVNWSRLSLTKVLVSSSIGLPHQVAVRRAFRRWPG